MPEELKLVEELPLRRPLMRSPPSTSNVCTLAGNPASPVFNFMSN